MRQPGQASTPLQRHVKHDSSMWGCQRVMDGLNHACRLGRASTTLLRHICRRGAAMLCQLANACTQDGSAAHEAQLEGV